MSTGSGCLARNQHASAAIGLDDRARIMRQHGACRIIPADLARADARKNVFQIHRQESSTKFSDGQKKNLGFADYSVIWNSVWLGNLGEANEYDREQFADDGTV
jgi:Ser-tRNA(Ala) deacylase AlaX